MQNSALDAEPPSVPPQAHILSVVVWITKAPLGLRLVSKPPFLEVLATTKQETECGRGGVGQGMVLVRIGDWAVPHSGEDGATANEVLEQVKSRLAPGRLPVSVEFRPPGSARVGASGQQQQQQGESGKQQQQQQQQNEDGDETDVAATGASGQQPQRNEGGDEKDVAASGASGEAPQQQKQEQSQGESAAGASGKQQQQSQVCFWRNSLPS